MDKLFIFPTCGLQNNQLVSIINKKNFSGLEYKLVIVSRSLVKNEILKPVKSSQVKFNNKSLFKVKD